jgi:hypothetical protein
LKIAYLVKVGNRISVKQVVSADAEIGKNAEIRSDRNSMSTVFNTLPDCAVLYSVMANPLRIAGRALFAKAAHRAAGKPRLGPWRVTIPFAKTSKH